jgi:1,2-diacylglycerol 3-beta-galactosyltransferase
MAASRVPQILFLIADTGGGHRSAANAIRAAMDLIAPETLTRGERPMVRIASLPFATTELLPQPWGGKPWPWHAEIRDIFRECGTAPMRNYDRMYGPMVEKRPQVWAGLYHGTNTPPTFAAYSALNEAFLRRGFQRLLTQLRPDVLVSVHGLLTRPALHTLNRLGVRPPVLTVVTDLVRFHRAWAYPDVDACSVPTERARALMIDFGMPPEKVHLLGMPIHPRFCVPGTPREEVRASLGLARERFTVLLIGGGEGLGNLEEATRAIGAAHLPLQLIVVTGRNHTLRATLEAERDTLGVPAAILGFVDNVPDIMRAADIIVTKAGPGTIAEALACGLPIVLTGAIPGQEVGNIDYVASKGVGMLAKTPEAIVAAVAWLAGLDPAQFAAVRARVLALGNPHAAFDIGKFILSYLPNPALPSVWGIVAAPPRSRRRSRRHVRGTPRNGQGPRRTIALPRAASPLRRLPLLKRHRHRLSDTTE